MGQRLFVSDTHLGHANICVYTNRPSLRKGDLKVPYPGEGKPVWTSPEHAIKCAERDIDNISRNWNCKAKSGDTVYSIGDFCSRGKVRQVEGLRNKAEQYERMLNGKIIHILGNHDVNNGVKDGVEYAVISFSGKKWLLVHNPESAEHMRWHVDAVLCGHVHGAWHYTMRDDIPFINVGVDVNRYAPLDIGDIMKYYSRAVSPK